MTENLHENLHENQDRYIEALERRIQEIDESRALAEKNCAAAELQLTRWIDLGAQLAALYPQSAGERRGADPADGQRYATHAGEAGIRERVRWFVAYVPEDIVRLRRHSQALHAQFRTLLRQIIDGAPSRVRPVLEKALLEIASSPESLDDYAEIVRSEQGPPTTPQ
jgi:hypothetical protein